MTVEQKLGELVSREAKRLDRMFEDNLRAGQEWKGSFERILTDRLSAMRLDEDWGSILPGYANEQVLNQIERDLPAMFNQAGLEDYTTSILAQIRKRTKQVDELWERLGLETAQIGADIDELPEVLQRVAQTAEASAQGSAAAQQAMARTMLEYKKNIQTGERQSFAQLKSKLISNSGILPKYAGTIANTSLFALDREVRKQQGRKSGIPTAKYMGPDDKITRKFCEDHLQDVRTWEAWEEMRNDVGPNPVSVYCGGYNCRHQLVPFLADWAEQEWDKKTINQPPASTQQQTQQSGSRAPVNLIWEDATNANDFKAKARQIFAQQGVQLESVTLSSKASIDFFNQKMRTAVNLMNEYRVDYRTLGSRVVAPQLKFMSSTKAHGWIQRASWKDGSGSFVKVINFGHTQEKHKSRDARRVWANYKDKKGIIATKGFEYEFFSPPYNRAGPDYVATHEFFHLSAGQYSVKGTQNQSDFFAELSQLRRQYQIERSEARRKYQANPSPEALQEYGDTIICVYAHKNIDEFGAEAFSEYKLSDNPRKWAVRVGELHKKYFGR